MKLQKQPNNWSCLPTAFASLLEIDVKHIIRATGHDGSTLMWRSFDPPYCYRGWHIQELVKLALEFGYAVTTIERVLYSAPNDIVEPYVQFDNVLFEYTLNNKAGIVACKTVDDNSHALIFERGNYYDTRTGKQAYRDYFKFNDILWRVDKL